MLRAHTRSRGLGAAAGGPSLWDYDLTSGTLPPVLSVARSGVATYVDASGMIATAAANVARFSRDPITHAVLGLLIEPQATYFGRQSEAVGASPWSLTNSLAVSTVTDNSPLASGDAVERLSGGTAAVASVQYQTAPTANAVVEHVLIKNVSASTSTIVFRDTVQPAQVNLTINWASASAGSAITSLAPSGAAGGLTITNYSFTQFSNGYWLVAVCISITTLGNNSHMLRFQPSNSPVGGTCDVAAMWGTYTTDRQSYLPTTTASVTRDADVVICSDTSRPIRVWSLPLNGGAAITTDFAAGAPLTGLYGRWTRIAQL